MQLKQASELFLDDYPNLGTRHAYSQCMSALLKVVRPDTELVHILPLHLVKFGQFVEKQKWTPATKRKVIKGVKTFFNWLVRYELIDKSPAKAVKAKRLATYISRDKAMSDDELEDVLSYVRFKPRDFALILFLADTGCRVAGAAGLKVEDISFDTYEATITEKGNKTRQVVFGEDAANALRVWLLSRKPSAGEYVFTRDGHQMKPDNVSLVVRRACKKAGIRSMGGHTLRHRKGHQFADEKVAPSIAATALGHSDPVITLQNYYPADWESAKKELQRLTVKATRGKILKIG